MRYISFFIFVILLASCKERYEVTLPSTEKSFLVVEGFINTNGPTKITLSRTTPISTRITQFEKNAAVIIEADDNSTYPLIEQDSGKYVSENLQLDLNKNYRLAIKTANNQQYVSSFEKPLVTPALDLTWERYNEGVEIFANAQDNINNTTYYRWELDETWEINSAYATTIRVQADTAIDGQVNLYYVFRDPANYGPADSLYYCWKERPSTSIKIGSTEKLSEPKLYNSLIFYPRGAEELSVQYSVLVRQYGLTKEGYEFFSKIKKNTESLGSIFDAQPSEIRGNVRSVDNNKELVIGYIPVSSVTEKRIFIRNNELAGWNYSQGCELPFFYVPQNRDSILKYNYFKFMLATDGVFDMNGNLIGAYVAEEVCVDCRLRGSNIKPGFWP